MAQEPGIHPASGYECFIYVYNKTTVDLDLYDSKTILGSWAKESPPNTISARTEALIRLNDNTGLAGSQGEVVYELYPPKYPNKSVQIKIEFSDSYGRWNDNYLKARSYDTKLAYCNVLDYQATRHPFYGHVEVFLTGHAVVDDSKDGNQSTDDLEVRPSDMALFKQADKDLNANFEIGFDGQLGIGHKESVHEDIAIAAFIASTLRTPSFPRGTTYGNMNRKQWEFARGLEWNDDPSCLLFENLSDRNNVLDKGLDFALAFKFGDPGCLTQRTHFGDMQFLHSMATKNNEDPQTTKASLLM